MSSSATGQREVCAILKAARQSRGLRLADAASALECSITKAQRMEKGIRGLRPEDVHVLLDLYRVPAPQRDRVIELIGRPEERAWWRGFRSWMPSAWREEIPLEDEATVIRTYSLGIIPELLHTAGYAREVLPLRYPRASGQAIDRLVGALMTRQLILERAPRKELYFLIDQAALVRPVESPAAHARQLGAVATAAMRPGVTVRMVPLNAGVHPGVYGSFTLLEFTGAPVMTRTAASAAFTTSSLEVDDAWEAWEAVEERAATVTETADFLQRRIRALSETSAPAGGSAMPSQSRVIPAAGC